LHDVWSKPYKLQIVAALADQAQKLALTSRAFYNGGIRQTVLHMPLTADETVLVYKQFFVTLAGRGERRRVGKRALHWR
jgi:hypothetical protein